MELQMSTGHEYIASEYTTSMSYEELHTQGTTIGPIIIPTENKLGNSQATEYSKSVENDRTSLALTSSHGGINHRGLLKNLYIGACFRLLAFSASMVFASIFLKNIFNSKMLSSVWGLIDGHHEVPPSTYSLPSLSDEEILQKIGLLQTKKKLATAIHEPQDLSENLVDLRLKTFSDYINDVDEVQYEFASFSTLYTYIADWEFQGLRNIETGDFFLKIKPVNQHGTFYKMCQMYESVYKTLKNDDESSEDVRRRTGLRLPEYIETEDGETIYSFEKNQTANKGNKSIKSILLPSAYSLNLENYLKADMSLTERLFTGRQVILFFAHLLSKGIIMNEIHVSNIFLEPSGDILVCPENKLSIYTGPSYINQFFKDSQIGMRQLGVFIMAMLPQLENEESFSKHLVGENIIRKVKDDLSQSYNDRSHILWQRWYQLANTFNSPPDTQLKMVDIVAEFSDILGE